MMRDTKPTEEVIRKMAANLTQSAMIMNNIADRMAGSGDLTYAAEAIQEVANVIMGLRMDLLVTRPIREYERILDEIGI